MVMEKKIAILMPTRNRKEKAFECYSSWLETETGFSDFYYVIDLDNKEVYGDLPEKAKALYIGKDVDKPGMAYPVNVAANMIKDQYEFIGFVGDDHRFRTKGWDSAFVENIPKPIGFIYGDDLLQGERLPTAIVMTSKVVETLGHMILPELKHLYIDDYWKYLGQMSNTLAYFPQVVIEHMHYSNSKSPMDEQYAVVNDIRIESYDRSVFYNFKDTIRALSMIQRLKDANKPE
jgi:glycosyltransferase involved in cell wall biosynthesis